MFIDTLSPVALFFIFLSLGFGFGILHSTVSVLFFAILPKKVSEKKKTIIWGVIDFVFSIGFLFLMLFVAFRVNYGIVRAYEVFSCGAGIALWEMGTRKILAKPAEKWYSFLKEKFKKRQTNENKQENTSS